MRKWTDIDDKILKILLEERFSGKIISMVLGRSIQAVYNRRRILYKQTMWNLRNNYRAVVLGRRILNHYNCRIR